ncbi:MAG TPA: NAD-dependent epimerase/dehydratase family protein [Blastocatellia bacterium]|nr:NAD-dependent epimerase/dehydratase family protein [Blastocatellia bacterium]
MMESNKQAVALVTGATGFVGSHVVDRLLEGGRTVRCLVRRSSNLRYLKDPRIEFAYGGLDDETDWDAALAGVDTIYHVAGLTFARRARDYFEVNQRGTERILGAALKHREQIKKFVLVSSLAAIGPARDGTPIDEDAPPAPITPYGQSKLMGEEAVRAVGDLLPATIVRPPAVYGPRDYALLELFKAIGRGMMPMIGRYDKRVSLVHARDLAAGIILAGESERATGRAYFISSDEVYSMSELAARIAEMMGRRARQLAIPRPLAFGVALAAEGVAALTRKPPVINRDKVRDLSERCWGCSIERAKRELGYTPQIPIEEGLRETIDWYKREGWL